MLYIIEVFSERILEDHTALIPSCDINWAAVLVIYVQWNLSITTTSKIKFITCDLFSNVF